MPGPILQKLSFDECARSVTGVPLTPTVPLWPADAFAIVGTVLLRSGAYRIVVHQWPPRQKWNDFIFKLGAKWRHAAATGAAAPAEISKWWTQLYDAREQPLESLHGNSKLTHDLLQILAAADEASVNAGLFGDNDAFASLALDLLAESGGRTLCQTIDPSRAVVLPKLHTPQTGLTFRSLTHHLALYTPGEMLPQWLAAPRTTSLSRVLLLPWPLKIDRKGFKKSKSDLANLPSCYGFFGYDVSAASRGFEIDDVLKAVEAAKKVAGGNIDAVVFPELALRGDDYVEFCEKLDTVVIGGLGRKSNGKLQNYAAFGFPTNPGHLVAKQSKHHRWRLDHRQVEQYGLDALKEKAYWWEHIELGERKLHILNLNDWLTVSVLVCEDLARQEPVSELVRACGPTLVVAILMDGPQLLRRWPGRYASVLADDPGTSVLTITSVGMAKISQPKDAKSSSVFALWNDAKSQPVEIEFMDPNAVGVVLKLRSEFVEEWTADGRSDFGETSYLILDDKPIDVVL
jgi:hypothetical protein